MTALIQDLDTERDPDAGTPQRIARLDEKLYPGLSGGWDDRLFRSAVLKDLAPEAHLLDVGAGAGIVPEMNFKEHVTFAAGVDLDPRVESNPFLHEGRLASAEELPFPDEHFDVLVSDNVLEHLAQPERVFAEVRRVLKPGGRFLFKTPNKRHYMPLVARLTPTSFHRYWNRRRGRDREDTFPTRYRANTPECIERLAAQAGLEPVRIDLFEGRPEYLRFHPLAYRVGWLWERFVNRFQFTRRWRVLIVGELRRPPA